MTSMKTRLPNSLKEFITSRSNQRGYGTSSESVRELIREEQDRLQLRSLLAVKTSSIDWFFRR